MVQAVVEPARRVSSKAAWALGLSLSSYVLLPVIGALAAVVLAHRAEEDIARDPRLDGLGLVRFARLIAFFHLAKILVLVAVLSLVFLSA